MRVFDASRSGQQYMLEMVEARRNLEKSEPRYDLFSGLLDAGRDERDNKGSLNDEELFGKYSFSYRFAFSKVS